MIASSTSEDTNIREHLIKLVKLHPALWNQCSPLYKLMRLIEKNMIWREIAVKLKLADMNAAKCMWKTLRDQFIRENKKVYVPKSGMDTPEELESFNMWCCLWMALVPTWWSTSERTNANTTANTDQYKQYVHRQL